MADRYIELAEDIEFFRTWEDGEHVDNRGIRHGSAALRRLLLEDAAGNAWRKMGFAKSPTLKGPDLLGALRLRRIDPALVVSGVAAGIKFDGIDWAFFTTHRADNPKTGVPATA